MPIDHSLTYTDGRLRNWGHRRRLREILDLIGQQKLRANPAYADIGCSNGYITAQIARAVGASRTSGYDLSELNIASAQAAHPDLRFTHLDLSLPPDGTTSIADLVTCFETLEHVGNIGAALRVIASTLAPNGVAVMSVPIEIGPIGIAKYLVKRAMGRSLKSLRTSERRYVIDLLRGARMSAHRPARAGYGTHFGFDYRDVEDGLRSIDLPFESWTSGTTRFFLIKGPAANVAQTHRS